DDRRALAGDEAAGDDAARFEQLARHDDIDIAHPWYQRQHRTLAAERGPGLGPDLDVIGRGTGALRDARDRRALHGQPRRARGLDDPVGEHTAALAAERGDEQADRARRAHAASAAAPSQARTRRRAR